MSKIITRSLKHVSPVEGVLTDSSNPWFIRLITFYYVLWIVCNEQKYGLACSLPCGNCTDGETCNHVNGTCPRGCDVGVYGEECQTREFSFYINYPLFFWVHAN
jgi:hypothetical protein